MSAAATVTVGLEGRGYDIHIGAGLLAEAGTRLAAVVTPPRRLVVVTDQAIAPLYLDTVVAALGDAGFTVSSLVMPAGENTKDFGHLERLIDDLLAARAARDWLLVALGGGVVGDLVGFAAAVLLRGIDFVQLPTTLLAQVDSSVGGKTGINTGRGKNLVGAFHQPRLVLADTAALASLPHRELLAGYAETVKYGLLGDADFFAWLEQHGAALIGGDGDGRRHAVATCCQAKAAIVAGDERETGERALLNLGHTFGHALEVEVGYGGKLLHGEAVAIGTIMAFELSSELGLCPADDVIRVRRHFADVGLPVAPAAVSGGADAATLLAHMDSDKKVRDGRITLVLTRGIGRAFTTGEVSRDRLLAFWRASLAADSAGVA